MTTGSRAVQNDTECRPTIRTSTFHPHFPDRCFSHDSIPQVAFSFPSFFLIAGWQPGTGPVHRWHRCLPLARDDQLDLRKEQRCRVRLHEGNPGERLC